MNRPWIVVGNLGVGSDEWTVDVYGPGGTVEPVVREAIQWCCPRDDRGREQHCHDAGWLIRQISALPDIAGPGGVIIVTVPGADVVLLDAAGRVLCPIQHYRSVMDKDWHGYTLDERALAGEFNGGNAMSPAYFYSAAGGAITAPFQPPFQLLAYRECWSDTFEQAARIITLADWITMQLTGQLGADPYMAQSQGVSARDGSDAEAVGSAWEYMGLPKGTYEKIASTRPYPMNTAIGGVGETFVMPASHDSVWARRLAFETSPWVIWTGGWVGWTRRIKPGQYVPSETLMNTGAAFEGIDHASALIGNTGQFGPTYAALVKGYCVGDYDATAKAVLQARASCAGASVEQFDLESLSTNPETAAAELIGLFDHPELAAFVYLRAVARAVVEGLDGIAQVLHLDRPESAAMTGNWAANAAFIKCLEDSNLRVLETHGAFNATNLGAAAEALRRYSATVGEGIDFAEAVAILS